MAKRFGKYILLDHIAKGGMADLYRAKVTGVEDFERLLAIKCMRVELARDKDFVKMFVDEAHLAGRLNHPNIAQIYELGRFGDRFYIAMELVEGRDLRDILNRSSEKGIPLPQAFVAYVIVKAAYGLHYAHTVSTPTGEPLKLVHRDISPPNILVSFHGNVKVVDFGIAKAAHGTHNETRVGVLKGKFAYMAPEQVLGQAIDQRTDIFTLGIVLYELLTRKRLFEGGNDFELLQRVQAVQIPDLRATLPDAAPELIRVLYNTLTRKPEDRYATAADLAKDLEPLLIVDRTIYGHAEAEEFMAVLYDETERRPPVYSMLDPEEIEDASFTPGANRPFVSAFDGDDGENTLWSVPTTEANIPQTTDIDPASLTDVPEQAMDAADYVPRTTREITLAGQSSKPTASEKLASALSGNATARSVVILLLLIVGVALGVGFGLPAFEASKAAREERLTQKRRSELDRGFGYLDVDVRGAKGARVFINGHPVGTAPVKGLRLKYGQHTLKIVDPKRKRRQKSTRITITRGNPKKRPLAVRVTL